MGLCDLIKYIVDNAYNHWCITALFLFLWNPFNIYDIAGKDDEELKSKERDQHNYNTEIYAQ